MWSGVLVYLAICFAPVVLFWLALRVPSAVHALRERYRKPEPAGLPIERLAADLRRVHRDMVEQGAETPMVRRRATRQAYDALLTQACDALGIRAELDGVVDSVEREVERLRLEQRLRDAGLVIR